MTTRLEELREDVRRTHIEGFALNDTRVISETAARDLLALVEAAVAWTTVDDNDDVAMMFAVNRLLEEAAKWTKDSP